MSFVFATLGVFEEKTKMEKRILTETGGTRNLRKKTIQTTALLRMARIYN